MEVNDTRKSRRISRTKEILGTVLFLAALILLLVPVKTQFTDPCGSAIFSKKVTFVENAQIKNEVTPPCREAHEKRMLWAIPLGGLGLVVIGFSIFSDKKDEETQLT